MEIKCWWNVSATITDAKYYCLNSTVLAAFLSKLKGRSSAAEATQSKVSASGGWSV